MGAGGRPAPPVGAVSHGPPPKRERASGRPGPRHMGSPFPNPLAEACRPARTPGRDRVPRSSPETRTGQRSPKSSAHGQSISQTVGRGMSGGPRDSGPTGDGGGPKCRWVIDRAAGPHMVGTVPHGPPPKREQASGRPGPRHMGIPFPGRLGEACQAARETRALPGVAAAQKRRWA